MGRNIVEKVIFFRFLAISNGNLCISRNNPTKSGSGLAANFKLEPVWKAGLYPICYQLVLSCKYLNYLSWKYTQTASAVLSHMANICYFNISMITIFATKDSIIQMRSQNINIIFRCNNHLNPWKYGKRYNEIIPFSGKNFWNRKLDLRDGYDVWIRKKWIQPEYMNF